MAKKNGTLVRTPYGFRSDPTTHGLVEDEHEQDVLALIKALRIRAYSPHRIALWLDEHRIRPREARSWPRHTIHDILRRLFAGTDGDPFSAYQAPHGGALCPRCYTGIEVAQTAADEPYCPKCKLDVDVHASR